MRDLAIFGRAQQKVLKIYCRSKLAQVGRMTLFSRGGGKSPANSYHYFSEIRSWVTPLNKYNPNESRSTLKRELAMLLKIILFKKF